MQITVLIQKDGKLWATTDGPPHDVANWLIKEARRLKKEAAMLPPPHCFRARFRWPGWRLNMVNAFTAWKLIYNDSSHVYTLNGRRCKSCTAVAKIAPDSFALEQWRKRQVAIGMMHEPRLAERVAVDPDNKEAVDAICEEAMRIAGSHHAADRGTQRHRAAELFDLGRPLITDQQRADALAWQRTIEAHGLEIIPQHVEGFAAWPEHGVTGRFDRIARYKGRLVIVDLKSGENAVKYPQGTAAQLTLYARAPMISAEVDTVGDRSTVTKWMEPPADLDLDTGYVILLGDDMEVGELWRINIAHGWVGAQHALALVDWRKEYGYGRQLAEQVQSTEPVPSPVEIAAAIQRARTREQLLDVWRDADRRGVWTPELTGRARLAMKEIETSGNGRNQVTAPERVSA